MPRGRAITVFLFTGDRYGRLVVVNQVEAGPRGRLFLFKCDCGAEKEIHLFDVRYGRTMSCGCKHDEGGTPPSSVTHGGSSSIAYNSWSHMKRRCLNPKAPEWEYY